jgi:NSS family neurotransmitter:Na+ symporter
VSTFTAGKVWVFLVGILAPIVLAYMLISRIVTLIVDGYADLPGWYLGIVGWGTIALIVVAAVVFTSLRWKRDPDEFVAWPEYAPVERKARS